MDVLHDPALTVTVPLPELGGLLPVVKAGLDLVAGADPLAEGGHDHPVVGDAASVDQALAGELVQPLYLLVRGSREGGGAAALDRLPPVFEHRMLDLAGGPGSDA